MIKIYDLYSTIDFGMYTGRPVIHILQHDPNYINWCLTNMRQFLLSQEAEDYYFSFWRNTNYSYLVANGCEDTAGIIHDKILASRIRGNSVWVESEMRTTEASSDDIVYFDQDDINHELRGMNEEAGGSLNSNID